MGNFLSFNDPRQFFHTRTLKIPRLKFHYGKIAYKEIVRDLSFSHYWFLRLFLFIFLASFVSFLAPVFSVFSGSPSFSTFYLPSSSFSLFPPLFLSFLLSCFLLRFPELPPAYPLSAE